MGLVLAWRMPARLGAGLLTAALCALPQAYTISARPGAVNYIEGTVAFDGKPLPAKGSAQMFLSANDSLSTADGKAEVLLTPGVFLRLAANSEIRMISPHLTNTVVEVTKGEASVEVAELLPDNVIQIKDHDATVRLSKPGLYGFVGGSEAMARVYEGKALVEVNGSHFELGKGREMQLADAVKPAKFDPKKNEDDLYAWGKVRDEYVSATSYDSANRIASNSMVDSFGGWYGPGWFWNQGFNSWAWLPGDGAYFSPFGFGYYAPGFVQYAPVVYAPVYGGGGLVGPVRRPVPIPVNPTKSNPIAGVTSRPVVPSGLATPRQMVMSGVGSGGGHVGGSAIVAQTHSYSGGGAAMAGSGGGGGRFSSSAASSAPMPSAGSRGGSSGGGSHK